MENGDADHEWRWPSSARKENWERIVFDSAGADLVGVFGEADGEPTAAIVLAHPNRADGKRYFLRSDLPRLLRAEGYDVFAFDFNDFGESEQGAVEGHYDIASAVDTVNELSEAPATAVLGVSLGGAWLVPALAELEDHSIDAAIFDSTYPTLKPFLWPHRPFALAALRLGQLLASDGTRELAPIRYAESVTSPDELLFIYGDDDSYIDSRTRRRLISAFPHDDDDIDVWIASQTRHNSALRKHPEAYVEKVSAYLTRQCPTDG